MKPFVTAVLVLMLCVPVFGQFGTTMYADIPFAFELTGTRLPAGSYDVMLRPNPLIRNKDPMLGAAFFQSRPWQAPRNQEVARLVFNKYGDRHFLSQVYVTDSYYHLNKSRQERELVTSQLRAGLRGPEIVVVMLRVVR